MLAFKETRILEKRLAMAVACLSSGGSYVSHLAIPV